MKSPCRLLCVFVGLLGAGRVRAAEPVSLAVLQRRAEARGYRIREVRWDPVLQQRWAVMQSVEHPELPLIAELTDTANDVPAVAAAAVSVMPVLKVKELAVRSGDRVMLWSAEENVRMQMDAVAESNAAVGGRVQLRVRGAGIDGDLGWRAAGIVRGPGNVEMER